MGTFKPGPPIFKIVNGKLRTLVSNETYDSFNSKLFGLGDLSASAESKEAIAAVFDLEGFTSFCKQVDPHLAVPDFLSTFLDWLMEQIKSTMTNSVTSDGIALVAPLPFFVKFMGDGALVLWDAGRMTDTVRMKVVYSAALIAAAYSIELLPTLLEQYADVPRRLRCGLAMGRVHSVGNGEDFVGSCINMAARVQKLPGAGFAFNRRGFKFSQADVDDPVFVVKKVEVRGIGDGELIALIKDEFKEMSPRDQAQYRDPEG